MCLYPLQLCTQKAEAMAVSTVMRKLRMVFQFSFFMCFCFFSKEVKELKEFLEVKGVFGS